MKIQAVGTILHDNVEYFPGQYLDCSDADATMLIRLRVAVKAPEPRTVVPAPLLSEQSIPSPHVSVVDTREEKTFTKQKPKKGAK